MRSNKIEEENKNRYGSIGRFERMKATFRFVPSFKTIVKGFNEVVGDVVLKALYTNVCGIRKVTFGRHFIGTVPVANNSGWVAHRGNVAKQGMGLWAVTVW